MRNDPAGDAGVVHEQNPQALAERVAKAAMEPPGPACLPCAGLGELAMLPAGDAEGIGVLVEPEALASARASIEHDEP